MATRKWVLCLLVAAMLVVSAGCGSSGGTIVSTAKISIAFQPPPASSITVGSVESLTAMVSGDSNNYGVDWSLTCPNGTGNCGTLNPPHTASGAAVTYTPPSILGGNSLSGVNIVAFATADRTQNVVAPVTVTAFGSVLQGSYILQANGLDPSLSPYQIAAVIVLDGNGNVTAGEQTVNTGLVSATDQGLTGTYFLGNDGRGAITINDPNPAIGIETFSFVTLSNSEALVSQMDFGGAATGASATGTLELQTHIAAPTGGYAFTAIGTNIKNGVPLAMGGIFNIDSANTISGNGSVADEILSRKVAASSVTLSGTLTNPDSLGSVTLNLLAGFGPKGSAVPIQMTGYIVDDAHMKLIESDNTASNAGFGLTGGLAIGQGAGTGTFKDGASFSGTYVFGIPGVDLSPNNSSFLPATFTSAGLLSADGGGNLTSGFVDTFLQQNCVQVSCTQGGSLGAQISAAFGGTYSVDLSGTGRTVVTISHLNPKPQHGYQPVLFFYLTGKAAPSLVLQAGDANYPLIGTGIAYPQSSGTAQFSGYYGLSFTQQNGGENDGTAQVKVAPAASPQIAGIVDANLGGGASQDNGFLGAFTVPTSNFPFPGILYADPSAANQNVFPLAPAPPMSVNFYSINSSRGFFIETDLANPTSPSGQVSFGYYAGRVPVCPGCP